MPTRNINFTDDELKRDLLHARLKAGIDALACGESTEIDDADLDATLDALAPTSTHRSLPSSRG
ncbi:hypothetical protein D3874_07920 [Oleomonas cavernae]|uniref:Uncharacterized protein n=1 Tax=Oleomonas cavernae TaxID=2320859 RepID=A0A418WA96_9PROT|nr:hypothetical protein [Oleomonas cavernae]RJF86953.1 hypothetical protein D3874_07920 [Oleomonas cavernae]